MFPASVAVDRHGNTYVADADAQRIKRVAPDGSVQTIAGGGTPYPSKMFVDCHFADGPAFEARFCLPLGIAVDDAGTVYIADADNHAIRVLKNGIVSTLAGDPNNAGDVLGPVKESRFERPDALALDRAGDLYVADLKNGIREITPDGQVLAVALKVDRPSGISVFEDGNQKTIAVADFEGIMMDFPRRTALRVPLRWMPDNDGAEGLAPLGYPFGVVLTGPYSIVYTDPRTHTIRTYEDLQTRVLAGRAYDDVENDGGGYRDGAGNQALFNTPLGIARDPKGGFIVADAGNRRLRHVSNFDARSAVNPALDEAPQFVDGAYNVVLIGNSFAWFDTDFTHSIAGYLERDLRDVKPNGRPVRVTIISAPGLGLPAEETLFDQYGDMQPHADFTILMLNSLTLTSSWGTLVDSVHVSEVVAKTSESLRHIASTIHNRHAVLGLIHPWPWELAGSETTYHRFFWKADGEWIVPVPSFHKMLSDSVKGAGLPLLDFWPVLETHEAAPDREPYFGTADMHFTTAGRALLAQSLAAWMRSAHPWEATP